VDLARVLPIFRSELQARVLGLVLLNPDRTWTAAELTKRLDATPVSVYRELQRALQAGLLTREALGRTYLYRAATDSPLFEPLRLLLERTVGVEAELRDLLGRMDGVEAAFLHGSFARKTSIRPVSDIDVLVLGNVDYRALRKHIREIERHAGREIDVLVYGRDEFASLARHGNALAKSVLAGPVMPLVGTSEDLEGLEAAG
jgi:predicted nucleotidyltransferase